jgi:tRNA dimethylallyltransferase
LSSNRGAPVTIHIVAGPTAGGKSAYAIKLAKKLDGIIINCDSMQIYDGLHILTAQPSADDMRETPHVLYSALQPGEPCSAGIWQAMALREIETALAQNKTPIICGGNGMYIKVLMEGLSPIPETPPEIRERAIQRQEEIGSVALHEELKKRDPESAARFHPEHTARIVRAWEVFEATGKKLSAWQKEAKNAPPENWNFEIHKIIPEREELYRRCDQRFLKMLDGGALDEVGDFAARIDRNEIPETTLLAKALGFANIRSYLSGKIGREAAIKLSQTETRQYAKRQVTWFKNQL